MSATAAPSSISPNITDGEMRVTKRNGELEEVAFDKILRRIKTIGQEADISSINYSALCIKVIDQIYDTIPTTKLDELMAEQCASLSAKHPDYGVLAARLIISNHHRNTTASFYETMRQLYTPQSTQSETSSTETPPTETPITQNKSPVVLSTTFWEDVDHNKDALDAMIDHTRDYLFDYFGFKTMEKTYLLKSPQTQAPIERPQHLFMRVAVSIHGRNLEKIQETYYYMSHKYFTHATPTLFNAGTPNPQLSSCFLLTMEDDSIDGIYNTLKSAAQISKHAGGIGLSITNIRANGSYIRGNNGTSNGIVPMLRVFNETARYVNQGNRRPGSIAVYLEPWHADIFEFLEMKKNQGDENAKARDLFYGLWIPDLFMERVRDDADWSLFCPHDTPELCDTHSDEFRQHYIRYETAPKSNNKARQVVKARSLWLKMLQAQMETGTPYFLYKDACNRKSNQKNLGTIRCSNLCTEIVEYSSAEETAVCNLASISLSKLVDPETKQFDYETLHKITKIVTVNLNRIIDINFYPTPQTRRSNMRHRPIGIGVQGLADAFVLMDVAFHSDEAREINRLIFETMYHASLEMSHQLAQERKTFSHATNNPYAGAYSSFEGSPASQGLLQFDLWEQENKTSNRYDWQIIKNNIQKDGLYNSLLLAPMPTASTSQLLGNNECFEPFTSNLYVRRTLAGEFVMINKHLVKELIALGQWSPQIKNSIIEHRGSIQHLTQLPEHTRNKYKIVWEIPAKHLIDMAADRGPFICQSQSMNIWSDVPTYNKLGSMHFYAWQKGLKTGIYYLRRKPAHTAQQFTIEPTQKETQQDQDQDRDRDHEEEEICEMCSA